MLEFSLDGSMNIFRDYGLCLAAVRGILLFLCTPISLYRSLSKTKEL